MLNVCVCTRFDVRDLGSWYIFIVSTETGDSDE
jgi:hypothetical protein